MKLLLVVHAAATLMMAGAILIVQIVHYPLFAQVGMDNFAAYEEAHSSLITLVVGPLMLIEAVTAFLLLMDHPVAIPNWSVVFGLVLVGVIWGSTLFLQVPQHGVLSMGFDAQAHGILVSTNWIRTIAWLLRGGLVLWWFWRLL